MCGCNIHALKFSVQAQARNSGVKDGARRTTAAHGADGGFAHRDKMHQFMRLKLLGLIRGQTSSFRRKINKFGVFSAGSKH